jgi:hypothetical protein
MSDAEVLRRVRAACAPVARPERFTDRDHCCECAEHDDLLRARQLDALTIDDVGNPGWDPICFARDEAFFYLLPALARLALDTPAPSRGWYFEQLLFHLTHEGASNRRRRAATPEQRHAVLVLLRHVQATRPGLVSEYRCQDDLREALVVWGGDGVGGAYAGRDPTTSA